MPAEPPVPMVILVAGLGASVVASVVAASVVSASVAAVVVSGALEVPQAARDSIITAQSTRARIRFIVRSSLVNKNHKAIIYQEMNICKAKNAECPKGDES